MSNRENSPINYDDLINESMYYIIKMVLKKVEQNGLQGNHHFYINFIPRSKGVKIPDFLKFQYSEEITIVIQYNFKNLRVYDSYFEVTLSFNSKYYDLAIPFKSITTFADPSESFELEFKQKMSSTIDDKLCLIDDQSKPSSSKLSNVISLEDFRKSKKAT